MFGVFCRRWGVPLIDGGTVRLPRLIGVSRAMDMVLTGRGVGAAEALEMGLANRVVPDGTSRAAAEELAARAGGLPPDVPARGSAFSPGAGRAARSRPRWLMSSITGSARWRTFRLVSSGSGPAPAATAHSNNRGWFEKRKHVLRFSPSPVVSDQFSLSRPVSRSSGWPSSAFMDPCAASPADAPSRRFGGATVARAPPRPGGSAPLGGAAGSSTSAARIRRHINVFVNGERGDERHGRRGRATASRCCPRSREDER